MAYTASSQFVRSLALEDAAVLITGGASGIGWATAQLFARAGARVMIADIDGSKAEARAKELGSGHLGAGVDVADRGSVAAMIDRCVATIGAVDVLVNNAGLTTTGGVGVVDQAPSEFARIMAVNLDGTTMASECAAAAMKATGRGIIINLASGAGLRPVPFRGAYSASKAGIIALTRHHAAAWCRDGIRVNAVAPGYTRTKLVEGLIASSRIDPEVAAKRIPLGRMADPAEIAAVIGFLASPRSSALSGDVFVVDGGSMVGNGIATNQAMSRLESESHDRPVYLVAGVDTQWGIEIARSLNDRGAEVLLASGGSDRDGVSAVELEARLKNTLAGRAHLDGVVFVGGRDHEPPNALLQVARAFAPLLISTGTGSIVAIVSGANNYTSEVDAARSVNAAVFKMVMQTLAMEWSGHGVRANVISAEAAHPSRICEIAELAHFLLSPEASYVTGTVLTVGGGQPARS